MKFLPLYLMVFICLSLKAEVNFDKHDEINGVSLSTGKEDSTRHYKGLISKTFSHSLSEIKNNITNFTEKCNNDYKEKRTLTDESVDCKFHVDHLIESKIVKDLGNGSLLIARHLYRRGTYSHHDLVSITEAKNERGQATVAITFTMLTDEEVSKHLETNFKKDSYFSKSSETYILTSLGNKSTQVNYQFHAETEHWLLNKELSVPQVFASISQDVNDMFKSVTEAIAPRDREVASHK